MCAMVWVECQRNGHHAQGSDYMTALIGGFWHLQWPLLQAELTLLVLHWLLEL